MIRLLICAVAVSLFLPFLQAAVIVPGAAWLDTSGNVIQAHGGGILKVSLQYILFRRAVQCNGRVAPLITGSEKTSPITRALSRRLAAVRFSSCATTNCSDERRADSSTDLTTWARQNDALTPIANTNISTSNIVERPKILYNQKVRRTMPP